MAAMISSDQIKDTRAYKAADKIQCCIIDLPQSKRTILHNVLLVHNLGLERWEALSKGLPTIFKKIVKELAAV